MFYIVFNTLLLVQNRQTWGGEGNHDIIPQRKPHLCRLRENVNITAPLGKWLRLNSLRLLQNKNGMHNQNLRDAIIKKMRKKKKGGISNNGCVW